MQNIHEALTLLETPEAGRGSAIEEISGDFWERYKSLRTLGQGCSGVVKKIQCRESLRKLAAKIIRTREDETLLRLKEEFVRLHRMEHPFIIKMEKMYVDTGAGVVYLVMDYFEGATLEEFSQRARTLEADPRPAEYLEEARAVFFKVVSAVGHLHRSGVVHRDLNPGNVLVNEGTPVSRSWRHQDHRL